MAEPRSTQAAGNAARIGGETVRRWSGKLKEVAGSVLKDDKLRAEGRLQREEAEALHRARVAEADASVRERQAEVRGRAAEVAAERLEVEADEQRARDEVRVEAEQARGEQLVDSAADTEEMEIRLRKAQLEDATRRAEAGAEADYERDESRAQRAEATAEALRLDAHRLEET
jgi:uncharacterized protein YjbJ (UPF0337 family)